MLACMALRDAAAHARLACLRTSAPRACVYSLGRAVPDTVGRDVRRPPRTRLRRARDTGNEMGEGLQGEGSHGRRVAGKKKNALS